MDWLVMGSPILEMDVGGGRTATVRTAGRPPESTVTRSGGGKGELFM